MSCLLQKMLKRLFTENQKKGVRIELLSKSDESRYFVRNFVVNYCFTFCILGTLDSSLWYGLWFIIESHNGTCRSLNSTVILVDGCLKDNQSTSHIFRFISYIGIQGISSAVVASC